VKPLLSAADNSFHHSATLVCEYLPDQKLVQWTVSSSSNRLCRFRRRDLVWATFWI